ncbi:MAG TPA: NAD(P)/FAD-dependent oxidoreductase [Verrucomicrobiae bacterium]|nr:NAD(P)/FAD-dependent oxidoreductase [Verrucomicrobiae bacterium]
MLEQASFAVFAFAGLNVAEKSIIIIGGGLAGLATACYGRMNGYRTTLLEHHHEAGGVAKSWKHGDYLIDGGIHYLMGHRPGLASYQLYRELGIFQNREFPDMVEYVHFIDEESGQRVSFTGNLEKLEKDLKEIAPEDSKFIDEFIAGIRALQKTDIFRLMETPAELMGIFGLLKQLWNLRYALRYLGGAYNKPMLEFAGVIRNKSLRQMITHLFLPEMPAWFTMFLLALLANRQMGLLRGGCKDFTASLLERYKNLGGEIFYDSTVKEILVKNDCATGVRLENGNEFRADAVVSACDGHSTIFKMLGGRYLGGKIKRCYENWKMLRPLMIVSFGVNRDFSSEPPHSFLLFRDLMNVGNVKVDGFPIRFFNYSGKFSPPGKTVVQVLLITDWKFWNDLRSSPERYDAEKKHITAETLARLEQLYPGITSQVEVTDIATPYTTWRYTLNHEGAFMGWEPTPESLRSPLPKTLPGLKNFYMAGQWVMPGGGVPPCFYSGRHVIQLLCKQDGKKFTTSVI